jgi:hypothetical protein
MVTGKRKRQPLYVQLSDLDVSTGDAGALLTAGASAAVLTSLENFYGQVFNLYHAHFRKNNTLTHYQRGSACRASVFGREIVVDLQKVVSSDLLPTDYSACLRSACRS